jgi:hypothetical protein
MSLGAAHMKAIGIGCFWFASRETDTENVSPIEHLKQVRSAIESVDNVSNVQIVGHGDVFHFPGPSILGEIEDDDRNFFPIYTNLILRFDIFMPERLKEKYGLGRAGDGETETFHVDVV